MSRNGDTLGFVVLGGAAAAALYLAFKGGPDVTGWLAAAGRRAENAALAGLDSYLAAGAAQAPKLHVFDWVQPVRPSSGGGGSGQKAVSPATSPASAQGATRPSILGELWHWLNKPYAGPPLGGLNAAPGGSIGIPDMAELPIPIGG